MEVTSITRVERISDMIADSIFRHIRVGAPRRELLYVSRPVMQRIIDMLPIASVWVLAETCRTFRRLSRTLSETPYFTHADYLDYLTAKTHDSLGKWVCGWCMRLHNVGLDDTPANIWSVSNCPRDPYGVYSEEYHAGCRSFALSHRHVQFALKCTRLHDGGRSVALSSLAMRQFLCYSDERRQLASILYPYKAIIWAHGLHNGTLLAKYRASPMILDGKFLLKSVWRYKAQNTPLGFGYCVGHLKICGHQEYHTPLRHYKDVENFQEAWDSAYLRFSEEDMVRADLPALETIGWSSEDPPAYVENILGTGRPIERAIQDAGNEIHGSCGGCLTDFSVQTNSGELIVTAWQDLGGECSPLDDSWRSQMKGSGPGNLRFRAIMAHNPGSVRQRYDGLLL
jgi:hypothetical protein